MNDKILIASYGTLRKGFGNSVYVDKKDNTWLGTGVTVEKYQMKSKGIPFVNKTPDTQITVDLWEIDKERDLPGVDRLEGYNPNNHSGSWYKRELIPVKVNNKIYQAWLYFNDSDGEIIKSGNYAR